MSYLFCQFVAIVGVMFFFNGGIFKEIKRKIKTSGLILPSR